jgi:hypothetical protein
VGSSLLFWTDFVSFRLVPHRFVLFQGRGGSTIKSIQERTGSNVQIPPQPDDNNPLVRTINITHPLKEQAEMTKYYIAGVLSKNPEILQQLGLASNSGGYYGSGGAGSDYSVQIQVMNYSSRLFYIFRIC